MRTANPWAERFVPLLDAEEVFRRAEVKPPTLLTLNAKPLEAACKELEDALSEVFYPTTQCVDLLKEWAGQAHAHCLTHYPSRRDFLSGVYATERASPLPDFSFPACLVGWAGTGKSQLLQAFLRILPPPDSLYIDDHHSHFPLEAAWVRQLQNCKSAQQVPAVLAGMKSSRRSNLDVARRRAFRDGVAFLGVDEFQFATQSSTANTLVTQMLFAASYLGVPFVYATNFSLLHKLLKRPQEDRQRLLSKPKALWPDMPESTDRIKTLESYCDICSEVLAFDPVNDSHAIYLYSAGIKRLEKILIVEGYRIARLRSGRNAKVGVREIEEAYHSAAFTSNRRDVEDIASQTIQNKKVPGRDDLWCPLDLPMPAQSPRSNPFSEKREERVAEAAIDDSLTKSEREAYETLSKPKKKKEEGTVVKLRKRKAPATAEELKANAQSLLDQIL